MQDINAIIRRLKENEEIAAKFNQVETRILSILKFKDLFEILLSTIRDKFKIPFVWISIIRGSEVHNFMESNESFDEIRYSFNLIDGSIFLDLIDGNTEPLLENVDLKPFYVLLPPGKHFLFKSIAVASLSLDGDIIGSLNLADSTEDRYTPGMDTTLLKQLSVKVSLCLSNVFAHEKLRFLAFHDPLTGLLNRRVLETILVREFERAKRYSNPLSLAFLDLDDFKIVNDKYGHDRGDDLLKYVADNLLNISRKSDVVSRFAGDEFVMILPETTIENASALLGRFKIHLSDNPLKVGGLSLIASVSFGIVSTEDNSVSDSQSLLKRADELLYIDKKNNKKGW